MKARMIAIGAGVLTIGGGALLAAVTSPGQFANLSFLGGPLADAASEAIPTKDAKATAVSREGSRLAARTSAGETTRGAAREPNFGSSAAAKLPVFDVARLSSNGASVFAGRAAPGQMLSVHVGGNSVGTVKADANGSWSLVTEAAISDLNAKLALRIVTDDARPAAGETVRVAAAKPRDGKLTAGEVNTGMMTRLQGLVDEARNSNQARTDEARVAGNAASVATKITPAAGAGDKAKMSGTEAQSIRLAAAAAPVTPSSIRPQGGEISVPVPIQFVFREASFTPSGEQAMGLLLQYLKLKNFAKVTLSGHADDRGTVKLNMRLSRERLAAVRAYLRKNGYKGKLVLLAKGESEPFKGVDRSRFSRDELYQLDRRVELRVKN